MNNKNSQKWHERFTRAEANQASLFEKASSHYDIMYAVQNTKNIAPWRAKIYVPILASKAWDLISRLADVMPYFKTRIKNEVIVTEDGYKTPKETLDRQRRIDAKLYWDYCYGQDEPMKLTVVDVMLDAVVAGTGFTKNYWDYSTEEKYSRDYNEDGTVKTLQEERVRTTKKGKNVFEPVNFFNVFIADEAKSFHKAKYIIVRSFVDMDIVKNNPNYDKAAVKNLFDTPSMSTFNSYNIARNRVVNQSKTDEADPTTDVATIYECFEKTTKGYKCSTYGEGKNGKFWVELEKPTNKYWHKQCPIQPFYIRKKSYSPWGESLFENNSTLQYATNDLFNHYLDNWNLSIDSMIMYEDGTLTSDFIIEPGGEITYTGEKPDAFKFPEPNPAQLSMVMNVIDKAIETATVPQYISGVPNSSVDKTAGTAKGISLITEAATSKIGYMRDNFKQSMVNVGKIWLSNLQQFQENSEEITAFDRGQERPEIILPVDYKGDISLTIDDDSLVPMTKEEKRASLDNLAVQAVTLQKAAIEQASVLGTKDYIPTINYQAILDEGIQYYSVRDAQRFIIDKDDVAVAEPTPTPEQATVDTLAGAGGQSAAQAEVQGQQGGGYGGQSQ